MAQYSAPFAGREHNLVLTVTEGSKDASTQKVRIDWKLEIVKGVNRTTWNNGGGAFQPYSVKIGGVTVGSGSSFPFNFDVVSHGGPAPGTVFLIDSGSYQFSYGSSGSLSLGIIFSADADVWSGGSHGSGTKIMGLASYPSSGTVNFNPSDTDMATQPSVTPKSANVGTVVTVALPRKNAAFTHDVTWASGALSGTIGTGLATSATWTVADVTGQFPAQMQSPVTITAVTKNGATVIGTRSATLLVWNTPPSVEVSPVPFDIRVRRVEWTGARLQATHPVVTTTMKLTDTASATPTLELGTSGVVPGSDDDLDGALVLLDVQNGASWQSTGLLFVLSRLSGDDVDVTEVGTYSGVGFIDFEMARGYLTKDWKRTGSGTNAGNIMNTLFSQGRARGWGPNVATSNPADKTTVGDGWRASGGTRELSGGTPYSQILEAFVNDGWCEWRSRYSDTDGKCYLDLFNPVTGSDWTDDSDSVIVNLSTAAISEAPTTWSLEGVLDRVYALGDAATGDPKTSTDNTAAPLASSERTPYDANVFGFLEGWASASGQTTAAGTRTVAANALDNATETKSRQFSYSAYAVSRNLLPYYTFRPGDWILVPSDRDRTADPVSMRVTQIILDRGSDGLTVSVICGDLIPTNASAATVKRLKAATGNRISGGTLKDPIPLQSIIPAAPNFATEEAAVSTGYWTSDGKPESSITFEWLPVTTALDGVAPIVVDYYEIWWRPNPSVQWALKTFSTDTSVEMDGWQVDFTVQLQVRARAVGGALGEFSAWDEVTTVAPTASIAALAVDSIYTDGLGNIFADWDGNLGTGSLVPSYFAYMSAEISPDVAGAPSGAWTVKGNPLQAAGTVTINPGAFGKWWIRFRAYDALGGPGVNGTAVSITTVDPGLTPPPVPKAPTGFTATAHATWDALGVSSGDYFTVGWTPVTQDTTGAALTVAYYEVEGDHGGTGTWANVLRYTGSSYNIPVERNSSWSYRVRAVSDKGGVSAWSTTVGPNTANATLTALAAPSVPDASSSKGLLYVAWDGLTSSGGSYAASSGIRYAYAEVSAESLSVPGTPDGVWVRGGTAFPGRAGTSLISGLNTSSNYFARIVVADGTGGVVPGAASSMTAIIGVQGSDIDPATIDGSNLDPNFADGATITGAVVQTDAAANTGLKLSSGGLVAYDSSSNPTFILDASSGSVWFGTGTIAGEAIDVSTINVGLLQASLITNGMGDALTIGGSSLVSIISGMRTDIDAQGDNLATYFDFGAPGQWMENGGSTVSGLRIASTDAGDAFNAYAFPGGFQIRRGSTALAWWEADPANASLVRFVTPNITVLNDLNVGSHKFRPAAAGVTIISAQ